MKRLCFAVLAFLILGSAVYSATYYVDSDKGSDENTGLRRSAPWKTLQRVSKADEIQPGDRVLFASGGLWRGILKPKSGEKGNPVYYGSYGSGPLPKIYGSIEASQEKDWVEDQPGIWATQKVEPVVGDEFGRTENGFGDGKWSVHSEEGAKVALKKNGNGFVLECIQNGKASNHIQVWGPLFRGDLPEKGILLKYRAKSDKKFAFPGVTIQNSGFPYSRWFTGTESVIDGTDWREYTVFMSRQQQGIQPTEKDLVKFHFALGQMPVGCKFEFELLELRAASIDLSKLLYCDVGNIIFDHGNFKKGHRCGIKKWKPEDLQQPGDYYYSAQDRRVFLRWNNNPAKDCHSIELALRNTVINQGGCHDIIYENLAVAYGAAHGFGGGNTERIIIRKCDIYYIGGGHQFTKPDGVPVRFGNGIEFWGSASDNLVENNRLWEIYDAALTNQGKGTGDKNRSIEKNIIYRNNLIWNSEYSFEYWNGDKDQETANILFENNICWDAGFCWSHGQRPNPNGAHLMFYNNPAKTTNFVVRGNIFSESTEVCLRMENDWRSALTLDGNQYYQSEKPLIRWRDVKTKQTIYFEKDDLKGIQEKLGFEKNGKIKKFDPPKI